MFKHWPVLACYALLGVASVHMFGVMRGVPMPQSGLLMAQADADMDIASHFTGMTDEALAAIEPASGPEGESPAEAAGHAAPADAPADEAKTADGNEAPAAEGKDEAKPSGEHGAKTEGGEGGHEPKKSFTGKTLSAEPGTPSITIGMLKVETRKDLKAEAELAFTPPELRSPETTELLKRRFRFTPYAHDVTRGPNNAPMTVVEFSDLSCVQCMADLKKAEDIYTQYAGRVRYVQVYLPVDSRRQTNLAAFYGKVAQRDGKYWEFREALFDVKEPSPEAYFDALVKVGVSATDARRWITTDSRRFYRELDADAQLSRALGLDKPPHFFVNGIHVGDGGIPRELLPNVMSYEGNYTHYQLDSLAQ
ncbi:MAG TPA: thioredoxin domain-containing protein [Alphaproteobacteria bacterium]|nr:thioredoxin domain-containing protein [Alphaproteobacteria bacterium]